MKKVFKDRIAIRILTLIVGSLIGSTIIFLVLGYNLTYSIAIRLEENSRIHVVTNEMNGDYIVSAFNIYSLLMFVVPIIFFLIIFSLGINRRVRYLKRITENLSNIEDEKYLKEIEIKGNDEIAELAKGINIMSNRLRENYERDKKEEKAKNELIVAVSHDLKTPLTSIIGYLDILNSKNQNFSEEEKAYLETAYNKSLSLKNLTEELFEYTKLTNNYIKLDKVKFNIAILLNQLVGEYIPFFNEKGIKLVLENKFNKIYCDVDIQMIVRVFENLIKNAEKYSYPNTEFKVSVEELNNNVKISFENECNEIKEEDLEKIFEEMYRMDKARNSENEGSGLGLAISRKIVELHGGELWAESNHGKIKFNLLLSLSN